MRVVVASFIVTLIVVSIKVPKLRAENNFCTEGYFQCANLTICVPQKLNCNGEFDCPNGSDEFDCDDIHDDNFFDHLFRKRPAAEHDHLDNGCNLTYNGSCFCRQKDLLCGYRNLTKAPDELPRDNIDLLDFTGNNFRILNGETLKNIKAPVNKLNLAHCNIVTIEEDAFIHLSVTYLYLDNNDIKTIPNGLFSIENNLKTFSIMYNDVALINGNAFKELQQLTELDLRGNKITKIDEQILRPLTNLTMLYLQNNQIRYIDQNTFPPLPHLIQLSLMENKIEYLAPETFTPLSSLRNLFLSNNRLTILKNGTFKGLFRLTSLTLNDNLIRTIETGVFQDIPNLYSLRLERNQFRVLDKMVLQPLKKLPYIYFDRFEMCEAATHVRVCYPQGDGISSQEHLLSNSILRACVWIMGTIGCTGNLIVLLGRLLAPSNNVVHSLYLRNLALSDLLMGIYLFTIATADHYYRGVYLRYQYVWRHSYICNLCGFLSTLSCESSVLILTLVTWDRFVSVTRPLARKQPSPKAAVLTLLILWSLAIIVSIAPLLEWTKFYFGNEFYNSNGVCLSLHIHDPYTEGWEYSAVMFILVNAIALIFISYAYLKMINEIKASGVACRSTRQAQDHDKVSQRFGIIVLTDALCWVPVIIVKLIALSGCPINPDLYAWLAIFILPINSALNPILYTLTTTIFKKQIRKFLNSFVFKKKRDNHQSAGSESGFSLSFVVFPIGGNNKRIYRGTQTSSLTTSKNSWRRPTAV